jgi:hypothetical protein
LRNHTLNLITLNQKIIYSSLEKRQIFLILKAPANRRFI